MAEPWLSTCWRGGAGPGSTGAAGHWVIARGEPWVSRSLSSFKGWQSKRNSLYLEITSFEGFQWAWIFRKGVSCSFFVTWLRLIPFWVIWKLFEGKCICCHLSLRGVWWNSVFCTVMFSETLKHALLLHHEVADWCAGCCGDACGTMFLAGRCARKSLGSSMELRLAWGGLPWLCWPSSARSALQVWLFHSSLLFNQNCTLSTLW